MKKHLLLFLLINVVIHESQAQLTRYLIQLKDKGGNPFSLSNPIQYLSQRAIDRRTHYGIAIDSSDLPVSPNYLNQLRNVPNVTVLNVSRWMNSVSIATPDAGAIATINALPFVVATEGLAAKPFENRTRNKIEVDQQIMDLPSSRPAQINANYFDYGGNSFDEVHLHNAEFLHNVGLRGQGMQIAMLDDGYFNFMDFHAFDSINLNNQVLGTWDFASLESNVINDGNHGMSCFSTIAANLPGQFIGTAPKAGFWLFRTEIDGSEYPIEEFNWVCGAERADSSGADIISTSLGYTTFDGQLASNSYEYANMNGNTTKASIAADLAAKKGILVFAANGNEGDDPWHFLSTPADGDSVVAVGAVNTSGTVAPFSSYGPTSDGQIKPDLASVGASALIENSAGFVSASNGTSFACPKMAGMATCLWQGFPEFNNIRIIRALQKAGSISDHPDDRIGYGIPNMKVAFADLLVDFATSDASINSCSVTLQWNSKDVSAMKYEVQRKAPGDLAFTKIADVAALPGELLATHDYEFIDQLQGVTDGNVSYRIHQIIDTNATDLASAYIDTVTVLSAGCLGNPGAGKDYLLVTPNPASEPTVLTIQTSYAVPDMTISIYDMNGRLMLRLLQSKPIGKANFDIPIMKLAKGKYIIKVNNGQKKIGTTEFIRL